MVFLRPIYWQCVINCNKLNISKIKSTRYNTQNIVEDQTFSMYDRIIGIETAANADGPQVHGKIHNITAKIMG